MNTAKQAVLTDNQSARLERILEATERLLSERGAERMTMRDVASASQVAEGTLYNRFGGKDGLITVVAVDYFLRRVQSLLKRHPTESPVQKTDYTVRAGTDAILEAPPLARALMQAYYRIDDRQQIPDSLTQTVYDVMFPIVHEMQMRQCLRNWVSTEFLCAEICERIFGVTLRWAQGHFPNKELYKRMRLSILILLFGASRGAQAREIEETLNCISIVDH